MLAFVLIRVRMGASARVAKEISRIDGVNEVYELTGDIDMIAKVEAHSIDELSRIIFRIREIEGVQGTDTRIVLAKILERR